MEKITESVYKNSSGVEFRRKWDKKDYENLSKERYEKRKLERERQKEKPTGTLKAREHTVNLKEHIGKTQVVASVRAAGFYCDLCRYTVKDSISYYDHLNSPRHLKQMGMGEQIEKSTFDQVKQRFAMLKRKENKLVTISESDIIKSSSEREESKNKLDEVKTETSSKKLKIAKEQEEKNNEDATELNNDSLINQESEEIAKFMGFKDFSSTKPT